MSGIIFYEETSNDEAQKDLEDTFWDIYHFSGGSALKMTKITKSPI